MYEAFYGLRANPFQLKPDPQFFFNSKGHKRAMAYLEYGVSRGEGFVVITGEVGAGKTTIMRSLFQKLEANRVRAAQIINTCVNAEDVLRTVLSAFSLPFEGANKITMLNRLELFLRQCEQKGWRALLVVDEAQNLSPQAIEELRMLSNFQSDSRHLLQIFLLGQPELRRTLLSPEMEQLRQRVLATYHLGPLDRDETQAYILHRLKMVNWSNDPQLTEDAFSAIYEFTAGIPRKINTLCDRLFLMGFLEELHRFGSTELDMVIKDIQRELDLPMQ